MSQNVDANRVNIRTNFTMPFLDTIAPALKIGEERTRPQDSLVWYWQGLQWVNLRSGKNVKDTIPLFHIGAGAPALRPIYAINGALRASNWGAGFGWVPRLLGDSTMVGDVDSNSFALKQWVINNFGPGGAATVGFQNGLNLNGSFGELGGTLLHQTTITQGAFRMIWTGSDPSIVMNLSSTSTGVALNINSTADGIHAFTSTGGTALFGSSSGIGVYGVSTGLSGSGVFAQASGGGNGSAVLAQSQAAGTYVYDGTYQDASTSTIAPLNRLFRTTSGTPAAGLGQSFDFYLQGTTGSNFISNQFITQWLDPTTATRTSQWALKGVGNAVINTLITFNGNGQGTMINTIPSATLFAVSNTEPSANNIAISGTSINGTGVIGFSTGNDAVGGVSTNGNGGNFTSSTGVGISVGSNSSTNAAALITLTPTTTNTLRTIATFYRNTSTTGANGIAGGVEINDKTTTGTTAGVTLVSTLTDATGASPTSQYSIQTQNASTVKSTVWTLDGNGNITETGGKIIKLVTTGAGTYTILANDYEVVATGTTSTWTLPATATATRELKLVNHGSGAITTSIAITTSNGTTTTTIPAGQTFIIASDLTVWRKSN